MAINLEVKPRYGEDTGNLIKRFCRRVGKEKIIEEFRERMYFKKKSDLKREKIKKAKYLRQKELLKEMNNGKD